MSTQTIEALAPARRSPEQQMEALKRANEIRSKRAQLKRDLKAGRVGIVRVLADPPEYALTMTVYDALLAAPKIGRVKANRLLYKVRVAHSKTLAGLSERQRRGLVEELVA